MSEENPVADDTVSSCSSDAVLQNNLEYAARRLYEYCQKRSMNPPRFVFIKDPNCCDHDPSFQATCSVLNHVTTGYGNNKKSAKQSASFCMLMALNDSEEQLPLTTKLKRTDLDDVIPGFVRGTLDDDDEEEDENTVTSTSNINEQASQSRQAPRNFQEYIAGYRR